MINQNPINPSESRLLLSELQEQMSTVSDQLSTVIKQVALIPRSGDNLPAIPQAVNQIWNGTLSHSVNSWDDVATANNGRFQCKQYYSHPTVANQPMFKANEAVGQASLTLGTVNTGADTIEIVGHFLQTGTPFTLTGSIPAPLATSTLYFVIRVDDDLIQVAASYADALDGTQIDLTTTTTGGSLLYDYTLKDDSATSYVEQFSDWDIPTGSARFQPDFDISTWVPGNNIEPGYTYYAVFSTARADQFVTADPDVRINCGLYAESTANGWDWIGAPFELTAEVVGTVATPTSRDYRVHVLTNRGFSIRSSILTVANAPSDADFAAGARVILTWKRALNFGVVGYALYRDTAGTFVRLQTVSAGTQIYIDNGSFQETVVGYPAADFEKLVAFTSTSQNAIAQIPSPEDPNFVGWNTIGYAIKVPQDYDMSDMVGNSGQWLRWYLDGSLDYRIPDASVTENSGTVDITSGAFRADMVGLTVDISVKTGSSTHTISGFTDVDRITVTPDWVLPDADNAVLYIYEGAPPHSISIDLLHLTYQEGAAFSPNSEDISPDRGVPAAVPNGTTQGPIIPPGQYPGNPDGAPTCLYEYQGVETADGNVRAGDLEYGMLLPDGYGSFNRIKMINKAWSFVYLVETENGRTIICTDTHKIYTPDGTRALRQLKEGDKIVTIPDLIPSPITRIEKLLEKHIVVQLGLEPNHSFIAGGVLVNNAKPLDSPIN